MIELHHNQLVISFPEVHPDAFGSISFYRTLRIPDDDRIYPLPAGLGKFQLVYIDNMAKKLPADMVKKGGVLMPIYNAEAMWIGFSGDYPIAIKIATGKINAITGKSWKNELSHHPQDFIDISRQPWLDGFNTEKGIVRQFTAVPMGQGYTVEEQITREAEIGGIQVIAWPMKASVYVAMQEIRRKREEKEAKRRRRLGVYQEPVFYDLPAFLQKESGRTMGVGAGGRITQKIEEDIYGADAWDTKYSSRCFIHMINASDWRLLTGLPMPRPPITSREYKKMGLLWFKYYGENTCGLSGSSILNRIKSLDFLSGRKQKNALYFNENEVITICRNNENFRDSDF